MGVIVRVGVGVIVRVGVGVIVRVGVGVIVTVGVVWEQVAIWPAPGTKLDLLETITLSSLAFDSRTLKRNVWLPAPM